MYSKETTILTVTLIALGALAVVIGYFIYSIIHAHYLETKRKREFMFNEMKVLELERRRIAQNIHDSSGPELAVLKLNLDSLENMDEQGRSLVEKSKIQIDHILTNLRLISHNMVPNVLLKHGLIAAINDLANRISSTTMRVEVKVDSEEEVSSEIAIHIYRILEEFIFNSIKHANATLVKIFIEVKYGSIKLVARDNGNGFDLKRKDWNKVGLGLKGFQYRTELLGGKFDFYSEENKGVEIKLNIPNLKAT